MDKEPFQVVGRVEAVLVAPELGPPVSVPIQKIKVIRDHGVYGDAHAGIRLADVRETELISFGLPVGIEIANHRQFSAISMEELAEIRTRMDLPNPIPLGYLCENLVVSGIPKFTRLPPGTMLLFQRTQFHGTLMDKGIRTAVLLIQKENTPCIFPGEAIQKHFPDIPGLASRFPKAAMARRGVVGSVYCSGYIHTGDTVIAKIPRQKIYEP